MLILLLQHIRLRHTLPFVAGTLVLGTVVVLLASAAGPLAALEAESGTLTSGAKVVAMTGASGGSIVQFAAGPTPTPSPTPSPTPTSTPVAGAWPGPTNTGVPSGTTLTTYVGPSTITSCGVVIDSKIVNSGLDIVAGNGTHSASTPCVTIKNSRIMGNIDTSYAGQNHGPLVITDSELAIPTPNDNTFAGLTQSNWYAWRINIHGARTNAQCDGYCELHDSWLHDNYYLSPNHLGGFLSNGNYGAPMVLDHNSLVCNLANPAAADGLAGCSGDINLFGDFSAITNVTVTNNILRSSDDASYCAYTGAGITKPYPVGTNLVWKNNVFERGANRKCASNGAVAGWDYNAGNIWSGNTWDDGTPINF